MNARYLIVIIKRSNPLSPPQLWEAHNEACMNTLAIPCMGETSFVYDMTQSQTDPIQTRSY